MAIPGLTARLYLDHHVNARLATDLRARGFDVLTAHEAGLAAALDEAQLQFAAKAGRAVLTFDIADYSVLADQWYRQGKHHAGIIISDELKGPAYGELLRRVLRLLNEVTADELCDTVRHLEEFAAR